MRSGWACFRHETRSTSPNPCRAFSAHGSVSDEKNLYHCFGCGAAGSVLDWVMKTQGVSLPHAVQLLRNDAPLANTEKVGVSRSHARHLPSLAAGSSPSAAATSEVENAALLRSVVEFYHANFKQSPEALTYLGSCPRKWCNSSRPWPLSLPFS